MSAIDFELIDIPIEFKKISPDDFDSNLYESSITKIRPNKEGYISEELLPILDSEFSINNTVVINAGVGQGKSKAIIEKVVDYSKSDEYIVVIAVPYNNLIEQYEKDCINRGISPNEVFNIQKIKEYSFLNKQGIDDNLVNSDNSKISDFKVHVMTINALLGNSGDESIFQSKERVKYFSELSFFCTQNNKKIVVVFDEIHDGIQNFKEEYIYKLWSFQGLIFKIFIISATFNEASKQVVKYLSEFTNRKISIVESERVKNVNRQSKLSLIFNDYKPISKNSYLKKLVNKLIDEKKAFDVILYSKKQAKQLLDTNGLLHSIKNELNLCYSDVFDFAKKSNKKYSNDLNNVGTNFTTGVNITKNCHTLIVVLPKRLQNNFINNKGVFSSGLNSLIQTLARQREAGEIYIVMPTPYKINEKSLPYSQKINDNIVDIFKKYASDIKVEYSNVNLQNELLLKAYDTLEKLNILATRNIESVDRSGMNTLDYPSKERFILEKGERFLTKNFFGGDLATYTFFGAITNQFLNCTLNEILVDNKILIEDGNVLGAAFEIYSDFAFKRVGAFEGDVEEFYFDYYSEYEIFRWILSFLENKEVYINEERADSTQIKYFKRALVYFTIQHGKERSLEGLQSISFMELGKILNKIYFQSCVKFSGVELFNKEGALYTKTEYGFDYMLDDEIAKQILHYKKWIEYVDLIEYDIKDYNGTKVLSTSPCDDFKAKFKKDKMSEELEFLIKTDMIVKEDITTLKDTYLKAEKEKKVETFYNVLVANFFRKNAKYKQIKRINNYKDVERINLDSLTTNFLYNRIPEAIL